MKGRAVDRITRKRLQGMALAWALPLACLLGLAALLLPGQTRMATAADASGSPDSLASPTYAGSTSCRTCHERFYQLWAGSHHGLAMQPYSADFATRELVPQTEEIVIGEHRYLADLDQGCVREIGESGETCLPIAEVLGGKNVYYFLTPLAKGRLQTLPVAFDVRERQWFDTAASGLRHAGDLPVDWRDPAYTFNTSCHGCHVSQLETNYDPADDSYHTTWAEPGINCETCHGPASEHNAVCTAAAAAGKPQPADLKIMRGGRDFTHEQNNDTCAACHAKLEPISPGFMPSEKFFDHFDLIAYEDADYYPDGRDLGENYTFTSWRMSPCVQAGNLDCTSCHTSSGRFKQKDDPNQACAPCHADKVADPATHSHHPADSQGSQCISCHMVKTSFARMQRSDHSMRPPAPAATMRFGSPNACNVCHADKTAEWADGYVRQWRERDYQAPIVHAGELIAAAREHDFSRLPEMAEAINGTEGGSDREEIVAVSLVRLLAACPDQAKWPIVLKAASDPSPLVRGAALTLLAELPAQEALDALVAGASDESRLVRVRAAAGLANFAQVLAAHPLPAEQQEAVDAANQELLASFQARPDQWHAHYNLGNFRLQRGETAQAVDAFETALTLEPRATMARVNLALAQARLGNTKAAEQNLTQALAADPTNAVVNFNLGLLKAEQGDTAAAEQHLISALDADPTMHRAAYNLCVLTGQQSPTRALAWCRKAMELSPNPEYAQALAYFQAAAARESQQQ